MEGWAICLTPTPTEFAEGEVDYRDVTDAVVAWYRLMYHVPSATGGGRRKAEDGKIMGMTDCRRRGILAAASLLVASGVLVTGEATSAATPLQAVPPPSLGPIVAVAASPTTITLDGTLNPNGSDTTYVFNYGTNTTYGSTTPPQDAGSGTAFVTVSAKLNGLAPATTYHFDFVATNSGGSVSTGDLSFTTAAAGATTTSTPPGSANPQPPTSVAEGLVQVPVSNPAGLFDSLSGVSCASRSFCLAVGFAGQGRNAVTPLVERWTGGSFTILPSPATPGAALSAIACTSAASCFAVGRVGLNTYAEHWSGHGWQIDPTPSPKTTGNDILNGVSCLSGANCWAVGLRNGGTPSVGVLVEHWNGRNWSVTGAPSPTASALDGVSCASAANCWAVGASNAQSAAARLLGEHWNGHVWRSVGLPGPSGEALAVTCRSSSMCWAAASAGGDLILQLRGGAWQRVAAPVQATFDGLACASARDCWAVGGSSAQWNGHSWVMAKTPSSGGDLMSIACPAPSECLAVGVRGTTVTTQQGIADVTRST